MYKRPLYIYVTAVAIVWASILGSMWFLDRTTSLHTLTLMCLGFALGMLAMYIAMHVYR